MTYVIRSIRGQEEFTKVSDYTRRLTMLVECGYEVRTYSKGEDELTLACQELGRAIEESKDNERVVI